MLNLIAAARRAEEIEPSDLDRDEIEHLAKLLPNLPTEDESVSELRQRLVRQLHDASCWNRISGSWCGLRANTGARG